jgi:hypothetical protein
MDMIRWRSPKVAIKRSSVLTCVHPGEVDHFVDARELAPALTRDFGSKDLLSSVLHFIYLAFFLFSFSCGR